MTQQLVALITLVLMHIVCFAVMTERKYSVKKTASIYAGFFAAFVCLSLFFSRVVFDVYSTYAIPVVYASTIVVSFIVFMATSADSAGKKIFLFFTYASVFCIIFCASAMISSVWFAQRYDAAAIYTKAAIRMALYLPAIWAYITFLRPAIRDVSGSNKKIWHSITLISVVFLIIFSIFCLIYTENNNFREWYSLLFGATALIYFSVLSIIFGMIRYMIKEKRMELVEENMKYLMGQLQAARENELLAGTIRHDFRHHNRTMAELLRNGKSMEALRYIEQYNESLDAARPKEFCPHVTVNAILGSFYAKAHSEGIRVFIQADTKERTAVSDMDFVAILSNLLENAFNGCRECGADGEIAVNLRTVLDKTVIVCANPCKKGLVIENNMLRHRGIGVESILSAARKYDGDISYRLENGVLTACVILNA